MGSLISAHEDVALMPGVIFLAGHLLAPLVAHVFCNFMGLPVLFSGRRGIFTFF